jgi:hypothetical protein
VAALLAVAGLAAGCGSDDEGGGKPIPSAQVSALSKQLDSIESRFDEGGGACDDILRGDDTNVAAVQAQLDQIPKSVDADVRRALRDSFQRLFNQVESQCDTSKGQDTTPTETTTTETQTTETTPTATETQPTETQTQTTQEPPGQAKPKQPKPPKGGGDGGQGGGAQSTTP